MVLRWTVGELEENHGSECIGLQSMREGSFAVHERERGGRRAYNKYKQVG
jgi:hypothetical protein